MQPVGMETLFTQALGLATPWAVTGFDFRQAEGAIHFQVECQADRLPCPGCGALDQPIHDRIARRWQHLHFFQFKAYIEAGLPRVACSVCGKTGQVQPPWSRAGSGFSLLMEAFVIALCQAMPVAHVARLVGVSDDRIWRVLRPITFIRRVRGRTTARSNGSVWTRPAVGAVSSTSRCSTMRMSGGWCLPRPDATRRPSRPSRPT